MSRIYGISLSIYIYASKKVIMFSRIVISLLFDTNKKIS